jgi:hypothetical protein
MVHNTKAGLEVWKWTPKRELAARLIAESGLPDKQIAAQVGVSHRALCNWKYHPEFASRVDEYLRVYAETVRRKGIAALERRIDSYLADWDRIETILRERGKEMAGISGGSTGLIALDYKGKDADTPVYAFDAGLMREARALREQLAKELGQWENRSRVDATVSAVEVTRDALRKLSHDELVQYERLLSKVQAPDKVIEVVPAGELEAPKASESVETAPSNKDATNAKRGGC